MTLRSRISALEATVVGRGRFVVAIGPNAFDPTALLHARGVDLNAGDTLVVIRKPVTSPVTISVDGCAY